jgi:hypothetical protein
LEKDLSSLPLDYHPYIESSGRLYSYIANHLTLSQLTEEIEHTEVNYKQDIILFYSSDFNAQLKLESVLNSLLKDSNLEYKLNSGICSTYLKFDLSSA